MNDRLIPWVLPFTVFLLWFLSSEMEIVPLYLFPHPFEVAQSGWSYIFGKIGDEPYAGRFVYDLAASCTRISLGFGLAVMTALPLGLMSGRNRFVHRLLGTSVDGLRAVPGITWLPLAMVWFGIGIKTTVFLVGMAAFFPIYLNSATGAREVDPLLLQAGAMMGVNRFNAVFRILIPAAMPSIVTGLRLGLGISWAYLVLGELTGVPNGLGAIIMDARMVGRTDIIVVGIFLVSVIGRLSDLLLKLLLRFCFKNAL
ncbi:ABC transporter, permease protein [Desulfamplus magnetovallimortis]|uniref:ABC transporter, permease protein n=1 Tax=Desulfamplus magnetovallimortis TaxID=1246637 RepID=A0A1W1HIQ0_9BACT|nr:ABC transporter permease [Desulfamplus magnetovallimortis]SLM32285.1 ABC transporter, permease protein [Desulfamplus magnetovallimortis]